MARDGFRFELLRMRLPSEEVARRVADAVRAGHFRAGDRLPSERGLAEQFGVSRPTIREAARLLTQAGILTTRAGAGGGTFVHSEHVPFDLLTPPLSMRPGEMDEVLELRRLILPWVALTATAHAGDDDFDRMQGAIAFGHEQLRRIAGRDPGPEDAQLVLIASMRFDLAMARATGNSLVLRLMELLLQWVEPLRLMTLRRREDLERAVGIVERCFEAIASGDPLRVSTVVEERLRVLEEALERLSLRMPRRKRRLVEPGP